jgi:hypothetical protein
VVPRASEERDAGRGVGFFGFEVEVDADRADGDEAREMDV